MAGLERDWPWNFGGLHEEMERFFDHFHRLQRHPVVFGPGVWEPAIDVYETTENLAVVVELAGVSRDEVEISASPTELALQGYREDPRQEERDRLAYHAKEIHYGGFERTISLPIAVDPDRASAPFDCSFLLIVMPKAQEAQPQRVEIRLG